MDKTPRKSYFDGWDKVASKDLTPERTYPIEEHFQKRKRIAVVPAKLLGNYCENPRPAKRSKQQDHSAAENDNESDLVVEDLSGGLRDEDLEPLWREIQKIETKEDEDKKREAKPTAKPTANEAKERIDTTTFKRRSNGCATVTKGVTSAVGLEDTG